MFRKIVVIILTFLCFLLQSCVFTRLGIGGIIPNLLIVLTSSFGFMRGEKEGLLIGFLSGMLCDIFFGEVLGFYALLLMYIGFINGKFSRIFYPEDIKLPLALICISDLTYGIMCYIFMFLLRGRLNFLWYLLHLIFPEMLYTLIVTLVLYPVILLVNKGLEAIEKRSAQKFV